MLEVMLQPLFPWTYADSQIPPINSRGSALLSDRIAASRKRYSHELWSRPPYRTMSFDQCRQTVELHVPCHHLLNRRSASRSTITIYEYPKPRAMHKSSLPTATCSMTMFSCTKPCINRRPKEGHWFVPILASFHTVFPADILSPLCPLRRWLQTWSSTFLRRYTPTLITGSE